MPYPPEARSEVRNLRLAGLSLEAIAARTGISYATVFRWTRDVSMPELTVQFSNSGVSIPVPDGLSPSYLATLILRSLQRNGVPATYEKLS